MGNVLINVWTSLLRHYWVLAVLLSIPISVLLLYLCYKWHYWMLVGSILILISLILYLCYDLAQKNKIRKKAMPRIRWPFLSKNKEDIGSAALSVLRFLIYGTGFAGILLLVCGLVDRKYPAGNFADLEEADSTITTTLFATFITVNLSLIALVVTAYVFLIDALGGRERYEKPAIDAVIRDKTHQLVLLSGYTGACIVLCLVLDNGKLCIGSWEICKISWLRYSVIAASLIATFLLVLFLYTIITHDREIADRALAENDRLVHELREKYGDVGEEAGDIGDLIKKIGDLETMVDRILENHENEFHHSDQRENMLTSIFRDKEENSRDAGGTGREAVGEDAGGKGCQDTGKESREKAGKRTGESASEMSHLYFQLIRYRDDHLCWLNKQTEDLIVAKGGKDLADHGPEKGPGAGERSDGPDIRLLLWCTDKVFCYLKDHVLRQERLIDLNFSDVDFTRKAKRDVEKEARRSAGWGADLSGISFRSSAIISCEFDGAGLEGADFSEALFQNVSLAYAQCQGAVFEDARFFDLKISRQTDLTNAVFNRVDFNREAIGGERRPEDSGEPEDWYRFSHTACIKANLMGCKLTEIDFSYAVFQDATFSSALLTDCQFPGASFSGAVFAYADLKDCRMEKANLEKISGVYSQWVGCDLEESRMAGSNLADSKFQDCCFTGAYVNDVSFNNTIFQRCDLESAVLTHADFTRAEIGFCCFIDADLRDTLFVGQYRGDVTSRNEKSDTSDIGFTDVRNEKSDTSDIGLTDVRNEKSDTSDIGLTEAGNGEMDIFYTCFNDVDLTGALLKNVSFFQCSFNGADLTEVLVRNVSFCECSLKGVDLSGAKLRNVVFAHCDLDERRLQGASLENVWREESRGDTAHREQISLSSLLSVSQPCGRGGTAHREQIRPGHRGEEKGMLPILEVICDRKSTRDFDEKYVLHEEDVETILRAALQAPSPKNRQPWHFTVLMRGTSGHGSVTHILEEKVRKLQSGCEADKKEEADLSMALCTVDTMRQASALILVNYVREEGLSESEPMQWEIGACGYEATDLQSIGAAVENMILQAEALSVDSLWIGDILYAEEEIRRYFRMRAPLVAAVALGKGLGSRKPRRPFEETVTWVREDSRKAGGTGSAQ